MILFHDGMIYHGGSPRDKGSGDIRCTGGGMTGEQQYQLLDTLINWVGGCILAALIVLGIYVFFRNT